MTNFKLSRMAQRAAWARWSALALGPCAALVACSVYDDSLREESSEVGGSSGASGVGGSSGSAGTSGGSVGAIAGSDAGDEAGAPSQSGSGGAGTAGTAGDTNMAGHGGSVSGASGSGGTAGSAGGGGTSGGGTGGKSTTELIDDMEDGDTQIKATNGRIGYWYAGGDDTVGGTLVPSPFKMSALVKDRSKDAAHIVATGFTKWGAVIGFNFLESQEGPQEYDASAYCGVRFWGKAAASTPLRFVVPDGDTNERGMVCKPPACNDHFGTPATFTTDWNLFDLPFSALTQVGTGYHPADGKLKTNQLYAFEWALPAGSGPYEIWIDDVTFTKCK